MSTTEVWEFEDGRRVAVVFSPETGAMQMSAALRVELEKNGWNAALIERDGIWGTRVNGSAHHLTIRGADGQERYYSGPFATVQAGDQVAIVRFG